jgi:RHS repeat-associated protein
VDRRGVSVTFKYDALDRRTGIVYAANDSVRYFYDTVGRVTNVNDSLAGAIGLTYDSLDRLTQELGPNGTNNYGYNDVGLRTNMTVTGETPVSYFYDAANRLTNVTQGTLASSLFYDDLGRRTKLVLPNGINVLYSYDTASRLTNITYQGAVTNKIDYAYDDTGNRASQASDLAVYNLPSAVSNSSYNAANQQLTFGGYMMLCDANGNVTNIFDGAAHQALHWSSRNQLTGVVAAVSAAFQYDGLGRRITLTVGSTTEKYLYDGLDIIQQFTSSGAIGARYFRGLAIDEPWLRSDVGAATTNTVYLADALGSIVALTDTDKVIQTEYDYEPFGSTTTTGASNNNSYRFTAREDDGTGLYYYRARCYHPALGRFVSEDPLEPHKAHLFEGVLLATEYDPNFYIYAYNDPLTYYDPIGLFNYCKFGVGAANAIRGGNRAIKGGLLVVAGVDAIGFGHPLAALAGTGAIGLGGTQVVGGAFLARRGGRQIGEAINDPCKCQWRNFLGLLPFGQYYDDPGENPWDAIKRSSVWENLGELFTF